MSSFDIQVISVLLAVKGVLPAGDADAFDLNIARLAGRQRTHQIAEVLLAGMAIDAGRFGEVFLETARERLLVIELVFDRDIEDALLRETQGEGGEIEAASADIRS